MAGWKSASLALALTLLVAILNPPTIEAAIVVVAGDATRANQTSDCVAHDGTVIPLGQDRLYTAERECTILRCSAQGLDKLVAECVAPRCLNPSRKPGACCLSCPDGFNCRLPNGDLLPAGRAYTYNTSVCVCPTISTGLGWDMDLANAVCRPLTTTPAPTTPPAPSCPLPDGGRLVEGEGRVEGREDGGCRRYECWEGGRLVVKYWDCPALDCPNPVRRDGQCCLSCPDDLGCRLPSGEIISSEEQRTLNNLVCTCASQSDPPSTSNADEVPAAECRETNLAASGFSDDPPSSPVAMESPTSPTLSWLGGTAPEDRRRYISTTQAAEEFRESEFEDLCNPVQDLDEEEAEEDSGTLKVESGTLQVQDTDPEEVGTEHSVQPKTTDAKISSTTLVQGLQENRNSARKDKGVTKLGERRLTPEQRKICRMLKRAKARSLRRQKKADRMERMRTAQKNIQANKKTLQEERRNRKENRKQRRQQKKQDKKKQGKQERKKRKKGRKLGRKARKNRRKDKKKQRQQEQQQN